MSYPRSSITTILWSSLVCVANDAMLQSLTYFAAAAFEVYVRRAYRAYSLLSIDYEEGDGLDDGEVPNVVTWRFNLGQAHTPPLTPRIE
jgi:hypothetical protein